MPIGHFARRFFIFVGILLPIASVAYFPWSVGHGFLVIFAGMLFAVLLDGLGRFMPFGHRVALPPVLVVIAPLISGGGWFGGSHVEQAP